MDLTKVVAYKYALYAEYDKLMLEKDEAA